MTSVIPGGCRGSGEVSNPSIFPMTQPDEARHQIAESPYNELYSRWPVRLIRLGHQSFTLGIPVQIRYGSLIHSPVAQLVEHEAVNFGVASSSLAGGAD